VAFNITLGISSFVMCDAACWLFWWNFAWRILREYQSHLLPLFVCQFFQLNVSEVDRTLFSCYCWTFLLSDARRYSLRSFFTRQNQFSYVYFAHLWRDFSMLLQNNFWRLLSVSVSATKLTGLIFNNVFFFFFRFSHFSQ
jgi:hypothetical protein